MGAAMRISVEGRTFIVTGGTQGVGEAIAHRLAEAGAKGLVITGRNAANGAGVAEALMATGAEAAFVAADLAVAGAEDVIFDAALARFGRVDGLINAAGLTTRGGAEDADPALWQQLFRVNTEAPFFLTQRLIRHLKARGAPGTVVNILSMNVHCGQPDLAVYSATKAAAALLTRNTAHALRFDRIRVNGINMGWADTPAERVMHAETLGKGPDWLDKAAAAQPFGRLLVPDDVARLALFLASDASIPMTGALIDQEQSVAAGPK